MSSDKIQTDIQRPDVSVVIVSWNVRDLLQQTLETLYRESRDVSFETVVVDNGSTDGSVELVRESWQQVRLISLPENRGFAVGNNVGFKEARGRYILLLNSDTIVLPTTLPGMISFLDKNPKVGCVGARHLNADGTLQRSIDNFPSLLNDFLSYSELHRLSVLQPFLRRRFPWWSDHDQVRDVDWVNGACMMVRSEVIEQLGGLDEGYFIYAEEIDWCYRMVQAGWRVCFTPEAEIIHLGGQAMNRAADRRIVLKYKGQYRFYSKHYPLWKYVVLRAIVTGVAIPRIVILLLLHLFSGRRRNNLLRWQGLTQEPVATEPLIMLRAWWKVLWLPL
ncbi:MAG TPA: glycosyltransferase family 2 protein [Pyrinomonadaceae bacterium]|nr:glycosyltransferase family 2 protein [Pyrinomonadaceae bacterium]